MNRIKHGWNEELHNCVIIIIWLTKQSNPKLNDFTHKVREKVNENTIKNVIKSVN